MKGLRSIGLWCGLCLLAAAGRADFVVKSSDGHYIIAMAPSPLHTVAFGDDRDCVLSEPEVYQIGSSKNVVVVPAGFVTDMASIPRIFWSLLPTHDRYSRAAAVHDYLYWSQKCGRKQADNILLMAMEESKVGWVSRKLIYGAVRLFGGSAWKANTNEKAQGLLRILPAKYRILPPNMGWKDYRMELFNDGVRSVDPVDAAAYCAAGDSSQVPKE